MLQSIKDTLVTLKQLQKKESSTMFKLACSYKQCTDQSLKRAQAYAEIINSKLEQKPANRKSEEDIKPINLNED